MRPLSSRFLVLFSLRAFSLPFSFLNAFRSAAAATLTLKRQEGTQHNIAARRIR